MPKFKVIEPTLKSNGTYFSSSGTYSSNGTYFTPLFIICIAVCIYIQGYIILISCLIFSSHCDLIPGDAVPHPASASPLSSPRRAAATVPAGAAHPGTIDPPPAADGSSPRPPRRSGSSGGGRTRRCWGRGWGIVVCCWGRHIVT